ncbi:abortive infection system antitoxin AbiGi family protein [Muribaculum intestinale]|uniref:abortive infection system antitoxin AbiGi family protein n=1 Tax=Muribaculum intestinale TaxID=1796646 RepID=UPI002430EC17|nr:abortive infection system antitoxin AbiGi family protein [Muribaculum intestinale]
MGLSSNILWHQTTEKGFYNILRSKQLLYSYSIETIIAGNERHVEAFPMISLSDLPFAELDFYLNCEKYDSSDAKFKSYGGYILGFSRNWGISNKFSPVWYCETYNQGLSRIISSWKDKHGDELLYHLIGNIKNTEGELPKANADVYRFYNEREYRLLLENGNAKTLSEIDYHSYKTEHGGSSLLVPHIGVSFTFADLRYIIVPHEYARAEFEKLPSDERPNIPIFTRDEVNQNFIGIRHHHITKPEYDEPKEPIENKENNTAPAHITALANTAHLISESSNPPTPNFKKVLEIPDYTSLVEPAAISVIRSIEESRPKLPEIINPLEESMKWAKTIAETFKSPFADMHIGFKPQNIESKDFDNTTDLHQE